MSDEVRLSREQMNRFLDKIKEPFNEAQQQKRRSVEVGGGFIEKVAALSAGSTAVLASLILAIANKSDIHTGWAQIVVHHLLRIAFALGASLFLAVLANFFVVLVARADAAIADSQLTHKIIDETLPFALETTPRLSEPTVAQVEDIMRAQMSPRVKRRLKFRSISYVAATWMGGLSMAAFVVAFSMVMRYLWQLW